MVNDSIEVDEYGVPLEAFGGASSAFFEILGRIVVVNGKIEYLKDRFAHLPAAETEGVVKVAQFLSRYEAGRLDRNAIVHSNWVFGAHRNDPRVITGVRYKQRKHSSGQVAKVSIRDVPGDSRDQDVVYYTLQQLRTQLRRDVTTMRVGEIAYAHVMIPWAVNALENGTPDGPAGERD